MLGERAEGRCALPDVLARAARPDGTAQYLRSMMKAVLVVTCVEDFLLHVYIYIALISPCIHYILTASACVYSIYIYRGRVHTA